MCKCVLLVPKVKSMFIRSADSTGLVLNTGDGREPDGWRPVLGDAGSL